MGEITRQEESMKSRLVRSGEALVKCNNAAQGHSKGALMPILAYTNTIVVDDVEDFLAIQQVSVLLADKINSAANFCCLKRNLHLYTY